MGSWQGNPRNPTSTATIKEKMSCRIDGRYEHSIGPSAEITTLGCQRSSVRTSGHKGMVKGINLRTLKRTLWRPAPPAALRLSRFGAVRWGGRGGVAHGAGGCGPAFPSSPAVIGLVALAGGWEEELGVSELNTPGRNSTYSAVQFSRANSPGQSGYSAIAFG
jgi:hypothetical protein